MGESDLYSTIPLAFSRGDTRLFRGNSGRTWAGEVINRTPRTITLANYHPVKLGPPGFPDLFGWTGPIFVGIEAKSATGRVRPEQQDFIDLVLRCGGRAWIARSVEDARRIIFP